MNCAENIGEWGENVGEGKGNGQRADYFVINENVSTSNNPLSLSLREGITNNAMNDKVMKGAERDDPNDLAIASIAV